MSSDQLVRPPESEAENEPWLWVNPEWQPGSPGLFPVIIGVSDYENLPKSGSAEGGPYGNMKGLAVSALTALHIFEWLRDDYHVPDFPIARCRVLLSPTADERQVAVDRFAEHTAGAGFDNCRKALRGWRSDVRTLSDGNIDCSTFFFFSGHGIEVWSEKQILLTSNWLREDTADEGINTQNLRLALGSSRATAQFYFIDACRNGSPDLRKRVGEGSQILDLLSDSNDWNPKVSSHVLYATTTGERAWQPSEPGTKLSVFGQALWEGLKGEPNVRLIEHPAGQAVRVNALHEFVSSRVHQQLKAAGMLLDNDSVPLGGVRLQDDAVTIIRATPG